MAKTFKIIGKLEKPIRKSEIIGNNWKKLENARAFMIFCFLGAKNDECLNYSARFYPNLAE